MSRPPPGRRAEYRTFHPVATRWMDNDVFGHVNNVTYYSYFDTAVCHQLVSAGILTWRGSPFIMVMAETGCRFHSEVAFPDLLQVGLRIGHLGERSVRYELAVFREGQDVASAEGFMVHVCVDAQARRPAPFPDEWRAALRRMDGET